MENCDPLQVQHHFLNKSITKINEKTKVEMSMYWSTLEL